jgi:glycosyltransferase involved in cell wall biosynthesis
MRVVYVSTLDAGGPLSHMRALAADVARAGADVGVICADECTAEMLAQEGIRADVVRMRHKLDLAGGAKAWPLLRGADIVHTHDRRAGWLVRPQARARGIPVVHTMHGLPEEINHSLGRDRLIVAPDASRARVAWLLHGYLRIEALLALSGAVVAPSHAMARFLVEHGLPRARVHVIPYGMDVRREHPTEPNEPPVVGTVTKLEHWKGVDVLVEACGRVDRPFRLEVFGDGSERDGLEQRARELGVDAVFHGLVANGVRSEIERFDVFVLPSRGENLPVSILEAMGAALPVVATRVGGIPEEVGEGETGLLAEPGDVEGLARAIETLVDDVDLRLRLARRAPERLRERFDREHVARSALELYRRLAR